MLLSLGLVSASAAAADSSGGDVAIASDYIYRGVSQTDGRPALQGDAHLRSEAGWYAGLWTSTVDLPAARAARYEVNLYAGRAWEMTRAWTASLAYVRYMYPGAAMRGHFDYDELALSARFEDRLALTASWSPNTVRYSNYGWSPRGRSAAYELSLRQPVLGRFAITGGVGYYDTSALFHASYLAWNVGLSASAGSVELTLARFDVDATARRLFGDYAADHRWAATAMWRF